MLAMHIAQTWLRSFQLAQMKNRRRTKRYHRVRETRCRSFRRARQPFSWKRDDCLVDNPTDLLQDSIYYRWHKDHQPVLGKTTTPRPSNILKASMKLWRPNKTGSFWKTWKSTTPTSLVSLYDDWKGVIISNKGLHEHENPWRRHHGCKSLLRARRTRWLGLPLNASSVLAWSKLNLQNVTFQAGTLQLVASLPGAIYNPSSCKEGSVVNAASFNHPALNLPQVCLPTAFKVAENEEGYVLVTTTWVKKISVCLRNNVHSLTCLYPVHSGLLYHRKFVQNFIQKEEI